MYVCIKQLRCYYFYRFIHTCMESKGRERFWAKSYSSFITSFWQAINKFRYIRLRTHFRCNFNADILIRREGLGFTLKINSTPESLFSLTYFEFSKRAYGNFH